MEKSYLKRNEDVSPGVVVLQRELSQDFTAESFPVYLKV